MRWLGLLRIYGSNSLHKRMSVFCHEIYGVDEVSISLAYFNYLQVFPYAELQALPKIALVLTGKIDDYALIGELKLVIQIPNQGPTRKTQTTE